MKLRLLVVLLGLAPILAAAQPAPTFQFPSFQPGACDLPGVTAALLPRLRCGSVAVPRDPKAPGEGVFRLAVVVIAPRSGSAQPDPVVYLAGGPGSPLTVDAAAIARHAADFLAPDRDLILVDQRGAGRSEPTLCPHLAHRQLDIFAAGAEPATLRDAWRATYRECREEMQQSGIKPDWFGTQTTGEDIETVRRALGVARWNVYALSYGTAVGLTMMAQHPDSLRAVVLDSVFPPDPVPMTLPQGFDRALQLLFAACRAQAACAAAHPDLEAAFADAVRSLDTAPLPVLLPSGIFNLRGLTFRLVVDRALYARTDLAALPAVIAAARARRPEGVADLLGRVVADYARISLGEMAAVECGDRPSWQAADAAQQPVVSAFVGGLCAGWGPLGPPPLIARDSPVPSLLLAGTIDPITPPDFARQAAAALGARAQVVAFAHVGHGAAWSSPCGEAVVAAFLRDPGAVDVACAAAVPPIAFR